MSRAAYDGILLNWGSSTSNPQDEAQAQVKADSRAMKSHEVGQMVRQPHKVPNKHVFLLRPDFYQHSDLSPGMKFDSQSS